MKTILVTGANSFIGCWVVKSLIDKGYNVRGTVRSKEKGSRILENFTEDEQKRISFVYINDISTDSFDDAVQNVDGIIHVASPFHFKINNPEKDLLIPAINGTLGVLKSAHQFNQNNGNQIKRIVITSSFASIVDSSKGFRPGYTYTENDWSPITYEEGVASIDNPMIAYRASKVCAEKAAWKFLEDEKPSFTIATICPPFVFGPRFDHFKSLDDVNTSNSLVWSLINSTQDGPIPETRAPAQVDVRDVAYAHVAALEQNINTSERYVISAEMWNQQKLADVIHESSVIPESIKKTTPIGNKGQYSLDHYRIDSSKIEQQLGVTFIPFKVTIEDLVLQLVDLKAALNK